MKIRTLKNKALSMCLVVAIFATYSMVALAGNNKFAGEISVFGEQSIVSVNGEAVKSGRTIFTSSTISTPENTTAVVNIAKLGKVKIAPKTTLTVAFNKDGISGSLLNGKVTVLNAENAVNIQTPKGAIEKLTVGESVSTFQDDDDDDDGGAAWLLWALVFGGAAAGIVIAATRDNDVSLGGGTRIVSPNL